MYYLFPQFAFIPIAFALFMSAILGASAYWLVFKTRVFDHLLKTPLVPPYIVAPLTVLSLLLAFMTSSAWQNSTLALSSLQDEATAINRLSAVILIDQDKTANVRNRLFVYTSLVDREEWGRDHNMKRHEGVDRALTDLYTTIWRAERCQDPEPANQNQCLSKTVLSEMLSEVKQLETAREQRLSIGTQAKLGYAGKWTLIYLLTLVSNITIGAVHRSARKTALTSIAIWCTCTTLVFSMITLHMHPYRGYEALPPSLMQHL